MNSRTSVRLRHQILVASFKNCADLCKIIFMFTLLLRVQGLQGDVTTQLVITDGATAICDLEIGIAASKISSALVRNNNRSF